jgi:hypothetical protein
MSDGPAGSRGSCRADADSADMPEDQAQRVVEGAVQQISDLHAKASGADDDQGIVLNGRANIVPARTLSRSP